MAILELGQPFSTFILQLNAATNDYGFLTILDQSFVETEAET